MTDERLEQILKQALAPEVNDSEIEVKRKTGGYKMKKNIKPAIAVAACAAIIAGVGFGGNHFSSLHSDNTNVSGKADNQTTQSGNSFTFTAYAAELTPDETILVDTDNKELPISISNKNSWALCGSEDENTVSYVIKTMFQSNGENIDHLTYQIENGVFQIVELPEKSILLDAKDYSGNLNVGQVGGVEDEDGNILSETRYVTEYTVSYDKQQSDTTWFNICGEKNSPEIFKTIWVDEENQETDYAALADAYSQLIQDVEITCTAYFEDGSSLSKTIVGSGKVMTLEEIGETCSESESPDDEGVYFIFQLK